MGPTGMTRRQENRTGTPGGGTIRPIFATRSGTKIQSKSSPIRAAVQRNVSKYEGMFMVSSHLVPSRFDEVSLPISQSIREYDIALQSMHQGSSDISRSSKSLTGSSNLLGPQLAGSSLSVYPYLGP